VRYNSSSLQTKEKKDSETKVLASIKIGSKKLKKKRAKETIENPRRIKESHPTCSTRSLSC